MLPIGWSILPQTALKFESRNSQRGQTRRVRKRRLIECSNPSSPPLNCLIHCSQQLLISLPSTPASRRVMLISGMLICLPISTILYFPHCFVMIQPSLSASSAILSFNFLLIPSLSRSINSSRGNEGAFFIIIFKRRLKFGHRIRLSLFLNSYKQPIAFLTIPSAQASLQSKPKILSMHYKIILLLSCPASTLLKSSRKTILRQSLPKSSCNYSNLSSSKRKVFSCITTCELSYLSTRAYSSNINSWKATFFLTYYNYSCLQRQKRSYLPSLRVRQWFSNVFTLKISKVLQERGSPCLLNSNMQLSMLYLTLEQSMRCFSGLGREESPLIYLISSGRSTPFDQQYCRRQIGI